MLWWLDLSFTKSKASSKAALKLALPFYELYLRFKLIPWRSSFLWITMALSLNVTIEILSAHPLICFLLVTNYKVDSDKNSNGDFCKNEIILPPIFLCIIPESSKRIKIWKLLLITLILSILSVSDLLSSDNFS